ncbi:hypothetical protein [Ramlibacter algicola]|uniref:Uncharacterized protein n=1 Tax=Ramlibacter algicola TaxID=2795217 RepID=A0A934UQL0_9BURK|nr:hypothetical protein [Ramlibacter algicola]MBK0391931.1 hypothetical protein [Ramlibacter algicola]
MTGGTLAGSGSAQASIVTPRTTPQQAAAFLLSSLLFVALLWSVFPPRWDTNDDVAMAMVAHGFGGADHPSAQLVFSNIAWGTLVSALGMPGGLPGYTLATFATVGLAGGVLLWAAWAAGLGLRGVIGVAGLFLVRATLFPQFTVGAGLLVVAGCACLAWYPRTRSPALLAFGAALVFGSFIVRREECLLVLAALVPILPSRTLVRDGRARVAGALLLAALAGVTAWDAASYRQPAWERFNDLNPARAAFTDYGRSELLKARPEILARHGLSLNDVDLIRGWFFADPVLVEPNRLREVVRELGEVPHLKEDLGNAWQAVATLGHPDLAWLLYAALLSALLFPSWRLAAAWALCLLGLAAIGYAGRPGVLRIYVPLLGALAFAPFMRQAVATRAPWAGRFRRWMAGAGLAVIAAFHAHDVHEQWARMAPLAIEARQELADFPRETVVVWGDAFPFEEAYAPLVRQGQDGPRLYGLGTFTYAPFGVSVAEAARGRDMLSLLKGDEGVLLLARDRDIDRLAIYCVEHHHRRLETQSVRTYSFGRLRRVWCRA